MKRLTKEEAELLLERFVDIGDGLCPHKTKHSTANGCLERELTFIGDPRMRNDVVEYERGWNEAPDYKPKTRKPF